MTTNPEPDLRIVTLIIEVDPDQNSSDVRIDLAGCGHYEAIGIITTALHNLTNTEPYDPESNPYDD